MNLITFTALCVYRELFWPRYAAQCGGQCNHAGH